MTAPDTAHRSTTTAVSRIRPDGWSAGAVALLAAWLAGVAIARLTGASAVVLVLATTVVAAMCEVVAGWWTARSVRVRSVTAPSAVTVDEPVRLLVDIDAATSARAEERRRITIAHRDGDVVAVDADAPAGEITVRFGSPGVVHELVVTVHVAGPAGVFWWRRSTYVTIDPLHVAPIGRGPLLDVDPMATGTDGSMTARRGNHGGEIDGVRPWRRGDATNAVHWASSLRSNELIVHDRLSSVAERWCLDVESVDPERLRWTLDEARRLGHDVELRTPDGTTSIVRDADDAARWSAVAAQLWVDRAEAGTSADERPGLLHRPIRLRRASPEHTTTITAPARWCAAAAGFAALGMLAGALDSSPAVLVTLFVAVALAAAVSLWVVRRGGRRPIAVQAGIVLALVGALAIIAVRATQVDGLLAALRGPLPELLMLLVVLHGVETVDRRTLRVHLAISFVVTCYAAGLRIDAMLGWWLAAWAVAFVASLCTLPRSPTHRTAAVTPERNVAARRPGSATAKQAGRVVATTGVIAGATLGLLTLIPIPDGPARLGLPAISVDAPTAASPGGLALPDGSPPPDGPSVEPERGSIGGVAGYPGFTEALDTSVRGTLSDEIVMRVRAPEPAFWRGQTFADFDGRTWRVSPQLGVTRDGPVIDVDPTLGDAVSPAVPTKELVQTYFVEQDLPNVVFAAPRPVQVIFDGSLWLRPDGALRSDVTLTAGSVYTVVSERVQVDADILRAQGDLGAFYARFADVPGAEELEPFLELPESTTERTIDLAASLRTPGAPTYDTILAYEAWLGANTEYDLDAPVPADGADAVDDFLFESRLGYCEQIASALTIMLRSQGVPARLATGYVPGERDRVSGVWNVRGTDAHAWVEVWFPQTGWQPFDPTAQVPLAADAGGGTIGGDLIGATLSSIASYRAQIVLVALGVGAVLVIVRLILAARYRRRRGRWGLLQDRFGELTSIETGDAATNGRRAGTITDSAHAAAARAVADELDRAAFDPSWTDDDERFERTRSALATIERSKR